MKSFNFTESKGREKDVIMKTYLSLIVFTFATLAMAQSPTPTPEPTPKNYLGHQVDPAPYREDELEAIRKIKAYKKKVMLERQLLIQQGRVEPNKWDKKFVEDMKAKEEEIVLPSKVELFKDNKDVLKKNVEEDFERIVREREEKNQKLKEDAEKKAAAKPVATPVPEKKVEKELSEEEKKYLKEKEEFLKKFKKQN